MNIPPHGSCWLWRLDLILLHAPADLITFFAYAAIPLVVLYVYRNGRLAGLAAGFPRLWKLGAAFVLSCGLSHVGAFVEVFWGGWVYWASGVVKVAMAIVSVWFAVEFWRVRDDLALIGRLLRAAQDKER